MAWAASSSLRSHWAEGRPSPASLRPTFLWLLLLAVGPQLIGHSTVNWALGFLPAAFVAITMLGEPIGSILLAYFLLNEIPSLIKIIGAILILGGIILASRQNLAPGPVETEIQA